MKFIGGGRRLRKFIFVVLSVSSEKCQRPFEGLHPKKGSRDNVLPVYPCHPATSFLLGFQDPAQTYLPRRLP